MFKNQKGFAHLALVGGVIVVAVIVLIGLKVVSSNKDNRSASGSYNHQTGQNSQTYNPQFDKTPLVIKNWPVNIAAYNSATQLAGDVYLNKQVLTTSHLGLEPIPLSEVGRVRHDRGSGKDFTLPTLDFLTKPGAALLSVSDGYVLSVDHQLENGHDDYEMHVAPTNTQSTQWMIVYDHLTKPSVKKGDKITAGQQIGETGPFGSGAPYSFIELQINYEATASTAAVGYCPYGLIAANQKTALADQLKLITTAWENLTGSPAVYNEAAWVAPGCVAQTAKV
jgi:murein DD-endopeptidase MepM/ murein hydrolase activator NlpD